MRRYKTLELVFGYIGAPFLFGSIGIGVWTYVWSIGIAFREFGIFGVFLTMVAPVLSQLFWAYKIYAVNGMDSLFVKLTIIFIICAIISYFSVYYSKKYADKQESA